MDFSALPPEVNSGLMYAGPGSGPMLAAATAWDGLAAELHSLAMVYRSVIAELADGGWRGPSALAMQAAAAPYVLWLTGTAGQAELTASQARTAAAAYEVAFAMTVPPSVVAANRTQLAMLVATNFWGQNAPAIAATEAHYGQMWAQDAAAMHGYLAASATTGAVRPFDPPPQTTNPAGALGQAGAVQQAAGSGAQTAPVEPSSLLQGLGTPSQGAGPAGAAPPEIPPFLDPFETLGIVADELGVGVALPLSIVGVYLAGVAMYYAELDSREIFESQDVLSAGQLTILDAIAELGSAASPSGGISAGLGQAVSAGNLSVPPSWTTAAPEIRTAAYAAPAVAAAPGGLGTAFGQMALAGMAGSALAGATGRARSAAAAGTPAEVRVPPRPAATTATEPAEPSREPSRESSRESPRQSRAGSVLEMAAAVRELGDLRDAGLLTEVEFSDEKRRLLGR